MANVGIISQEAFSESKSLLTVNIENVIIIDEYSFGESNAHTITIQNVKYIEENAFNRCPKLTHLSIGNAFLIDDKSISELYVADHIIKHPFKYSRINAKIMKHIKIHKFQ